MRRKEGRIAKEKPWREGGEEWKGIKACRRRERRIGEGKKSRVRGGRRRKVMEGDEGMG